MVVKVVASSHGCYLYAMLLTTIKLTPAARLCLRRVAALTEEKHYQVLDRLLAAEEARIAHLPRAQPLLPAVDCDQLTPWRGAWPLDPTRTREDYRHVSGIMGVDDLYPAIEPAK